MRCALSRLCAVVEALRAEHPCLSKSFVPLDKLHISLAVVAIKPEQLQRLIQVRQQLYSALRRPDTSPQIFETQVAGLQAHTISHSVVGRFRRDVLFLDVLAPPQLSDFCVRLHA